MPGLRRPTRLGALAAAVLVLAGATTAAALYATGASTSAQVTTGRLAPPTGLAVTGTSIATLSWTATSSTFATGTRILRGIAPGGPYAALADVSGPATTTYKDGTVAGGRTYYYVVQAYYRSWSSLPSGEVSITMPASPLRQSATACQGNPSARSVSAAFGFAPTAGDLLVAVAATNQATVITMLGWTRVTGNLVTDTPHEVIFSKVATAADTTVGVDYVAVTNGAAGLQIYDFAGVPNTTAGNPGSGSATSGTALSSGTVTVTDPDALVFAGFASNSASLTLFTNWTAGFEGQSSHCAGANNDATFGAAWRTTTAAGTYGVQATAGGSGAWAGHVVAFGPIK